VRVPEAIEINEHTFTYWQEVGGTQKIVSGEYVAISDITFKAQYNKTQYNAYTVRS
jgi:uncharacterized sporulation protein YeaH/YhbH (DUF444 family)